MPLPQKKCNLKKVRQQLQEITQDSATSSSSALNEWARSCMGVEDDVIGALVQCSAARDDGLRILAVEQLLEMGMTSPGLRPEIVSALLDRADDRNGRVLSMVSDRLPPIIHACTREENAVLDVLLTACGDSESVNKRVAVFELLRMAVGRFPRRTNEIITTVIRGCKDDRSEVRRQAIEKVSYMAEARPERAPEILDVLIQLLTNCDSSMYLHTSSELEKIIALIPDRIEEIASNLIDMCDSENGYISPSVMKLLTRSAHLRLEKADVIVDPLLRWLPIAGGYTKADVLGPLVDLMELCPTKRIEIAEAVLQRLNGGGGYTSTDEYDFRTGALCVAVKAVKGCPERASDIVAALTRITSEPPHSSYRSQAVRVLSESITTDLGIVNEVANTLTTACSGSVTPVTRTHAVRRLSDAIEACPDMSRGIIEVILQCCEDEDKDVRSSAIRQLAKAAVLRPERSEKIVKVLLQFCTSEDKINRAAAIDGLAQTASVCPEKSALIVARLLYGCVDDDPHVRDAAKGSLTKALPHRPDMVVKLLERIIQDGCNKKEVTTSGELKESESPPD